MRYKYKYLGFALNIIYRIQDKNAHINYFSGETVTVKGTLHDLVRIFSKYVNVFYYTYSLFR